MIHRRRPFVAARRAVGARLTAGEVILAELVALALVVVLRLTTLLIGASHLVAGVRGEQEGLEAFAFTVVSVTSVAVLVRAWATGPERVLDRWAAAAELAAGLTGLLLLAEATPVRELTGSDFWILQWTVITAVVFSAARGHAALGLAGALVLMAGYIAAVAPALKGGSASAVSVVIDNAASYPGFFVLGLIGVRMLRYICGQVDMLRRHSAVLASEHARLAVAERSYQVGHNIPKAYLRELWLADKPAPFLRLWATRIGADLRAEMGPIQRVAVTLAEELESVKATFVGSMPLTLDTSGLAGALPGVPVLVIAEAVRECLNNASFHGDGAAVMVTAASDHEAVTVAVHDDGPGCVPERVMAAWALKQNSVFLVEAAGGEYRVESPPGCGTTVRLAFPLPGKG